MSEKTRKNSERGASSSSCTRVAFTKGGYFSSEKAARVKGATVAIDKRRPPMKSILRNRTHFSIYKTEKRRDRNAVRPWKSRKYKMIERKDKIGVECTGCSNIQEILIIL